MLVKLFSKNSIKWVMPAVRLFAWDQRYESRVWRVRINNQTMPATIHHVIVYSDYTYELNHVLQPDKWGSAVREKVAYDS